VFCLVVSVFSFAFVAATRATESQRLPGHIPGAVTRLNLQPVDRLPASQRLSLAIGLPLRNRDTLTNLLQQL